MSSETVRPVATGNEYKSGVREREQASQLPLRCMRATEYFRGPLREKWVEATVYLRGSLRRLSVAVLAGRGGTTLRLL